MENRVEALEKGQKDIKKSIDGLNSAFIRLEQMFNSRMDSEDDMLQTLRNLDDSMNKIRLEISDMKMDNYKVLRAELSPAFELGRNNKAAIADFKLEEEAKHTVTVDKVERRIQKQAAALTIVCWALILLIYQDIREDATSNTEKQEIHSTTHHHTKHHNLKE